MPVIPRRQAEPPKPKPKARGKVSYVARVRAPEGGDENSIVQLWVVAREGGKDIVVESGQLYGTMFASDAEKLVEAMGLPVERETTHWKIEPLSSWPILPYELKESAAVKFDGGASL